MFKQTSGGKGPEREAVGKWGIIRLLSDLLPGEEKRGGAHAKGRELMAICVARSNSLITT